MECILEKEISIESFPEFCCCYKNGVSVTTIKLCEEEEEEEEEGGGGGGGGGGG
jgi:hypothetical protein